MSRIEKINSLNFERVRGSYINRQRTSESVRGTTAVEPVFPAHNQTAFSSENHLIAYNNYYRNLRKLEREFASFLGDKKYLEEQIKKEQKKKLRCKKSDLYRKLKSLISKYNSTIDTLLYIDNKFNDGGIKEIKAHLAKFENSLLQLGIKTNGLHLEINGDFYWEKFLKSKDPLKELFVPLAALIMALYIRFRKILLLDRTSYNTYEEDFKGTIINQAL